MGLFVEVVLPLPLKQFFTYAVTEQEAAFLIPGMRLAVPFGKSKVYTALVYSIHENPPQTYQAKPILSILDAAPIVTHEQIKHWEWISHYYMCSLGEVFKSAIPSAFLLEGETHISRNKDRSIEDLSVEISDSEYIVLEALEAQDVLSIQTINNLIDRSKVFTVIESLIRHQLVKVEERLTAKYAPKFRNEYILSNAFTSPKAILETLAFLKKAPKQLALYDWFLSQATLKDIPITASLLKREAQGISALKALEEKGIVLRQAVRTDRVVYNPNTNRTSLKVLNEDQAAALKTVNLSFSRGQVCLLHGVTASGKTEVYVSLIKEMFLAHKQVLYLLPEIALTTQLITRLQSYFGDQVAVYHSKYNVQERVEVWQQVLSGSKKAQLIIGARSSLFLPFKNLGLIVVDEEHESSFKQYDPAPRYHARDSAVVLAKLTNASIVLGSATPSLESIYNVQTGKYGLAYLKARHANIQMPKINLVDLKEQYKKKQMKLHFSEPLRLAIEAVLLAKEQVILFQNRRGFAPVVECFSCGHTPHCKSCDVSLTFHAGHGVLRCHYCGYEESKTAHCTSCGSLEIDTKGFGTEQVVASLGILFPMAKVGRMDLDTTRSKDGYQKIIDSFESHEIDILVGTQMLSKGLDFRNVSLVGVMSADALLNFPDFRAHEKTFQLLTQVAGRAGRTAKQGNVLIQTFNPHHEILQQVALHDYEGMSKEQLYQRKIYRYPPFNKIVKITLKHQDYNKVNEAAEWYATGLKNIFNTGVLGPEFPAVARIRKLYLKHILLKIPPHIKVKAAKTSLLRLGVSFEAIGQFKGVRLIFSVDPL
jgi:primosomal protein N' (replication factor Y)